MGESKTKSILVVVAGILSMILLVAGIIAAVVCVKQLTCEHVWDDGKVKVEATCTREGSVVYTCDDCGKTQKETVAKVSHFWKEYSAVNSTCTSDGHNAYIVCEVCGTYKDGHEFEPDLTLGHMEQTLEGKAATCTEPGITTGLKCMRCKEILVAQREIPAKGHKIVRVSEKEATCSGAGHTSGQMCANCGVMYVGQVIPILDHVDNNSDEQCDVCGVPAVQRIKDASNFKTGKWYRFYVNPDDPNAMVYIELQLHYGEGFDGWFKYAGSNIEVDLPQVIVGFGSNGSGVYFNGEWLPFDMEVEVGSGYVDVYFDINTSVQAGGGGKTLVYFFIEEYTEALEIYSTSGSYVAVLDAKMLGYRE